MRRNKKGLSRQCAVAADPDEPHKFLGTPLSSHLCNPPPVVLVCICQGRGMAELEAPIRTMLAALKNGNFKRGRVWGQLESERRRGKEGTNVRKT